MNFRRLKSLVFRYWAIGCVITMVASIALFIWQTWIDRETLDLIRQHGGRVEKSGSGLNIVFGSSGGEDWPKLFSKLAVLHKLKSLEFSGTHVGDDELRGIGDLSQLESLTLDDVPISEEGMAVIGAMGLQRLSLKHAPITDAGFERVACTSSLRSLTLAGTRITSACGPHLGKFRALTYLDLTGTDFDESGMPCLSNLSSLEWLNLSSTKITNESLTHLANLPILKHLILFVTKIGDEGAAQLGNLRSLETLRLGHEMTDGGLVHLRSLEQLEWLDVSESKVTAQGLAVVCELPKLRLISCSRKLGESREVAALRATFPNVGIGGY